MWARWRSSRDGERRRPSPQTPGYLVVVDPGASRLRVLAAEVDGRQSMIWGWDDAPGWGGSDVQRLLPSYREMLSRAEAMAQHRADYWQLPDHLLVGLPGSQLRGQAWTITQQRVQPERPIEERELKALLGRALRLTVNRLQSPAFRTSTPPPRSSAGADSSRSSWLLVEATVVALTVDGRRVTDSTGFRGQEIGATVFSALTNADTVDAWGKIARVLEFSTLTLTAAPMALTSALAESQGILLDVGGATTDLTLWRAGRPVALDSVPIGGSAVTLSLSRRWNLPLEEAERLKHAYVSGLLDEDDRVRVRQVISLAVQAWAEGIERALSALNPGDTLPERLYLCGGGSALPETVEAVRSLAWSENLRFDRHPQVGYLRATDVHGVINRTEQGRAGGDVAALALAAWAARQNHASDRPARILNELCED